MTDLCCWFQVCTVASRQQFKYKLHDCFSDVPICCLGTWCPCVLWGMNASFGMGAELVHFDAPSAASASMDISTYEQFDSDATGLVRIGCVCQEIMTKC